MKSDVILVSSDGGKLEKALDLTERVVAYWRLPPKMALHLRLLTEELMGMMHGITGERYGDFWIEVESGICMLHLRTETTMDSEKREALLAAASDGSNDAAKGLMGWIRDLFDRGADADVAALSATVAPYDSTAIGNVFDWSLTQFRETLAMSRKSSPKAEEVWDQLEKSVVAHVADDVKVSIRGREVELILYKNLLTQ
ncbi:MAG: hypothetical protein IJ573_03465 [Clostridia bacterium]|nr:hypothetical protein [Clostridia bacterium]